jgi:hypothetical protein
MKRIKYAQGTKHDLFLPVFVAKVKKRILNEKQKDDCLFLIAGKTGTGKSTLLLWLYSIYTPNQELRFVPRSQAEFASSLKATKGIPIGDRVLLYDEAEAGKRDSMSKWNKDLIRVYSKIRGKRIFHAWCYPDSDMIDNKIISNRVNGIFVTYEKNTDGIRRYYYFSQEKINAFLTEYGKLKLDLLIEKANKYAAFEGYFTEYDGALRDAYFARKEEGMDEEIDTFSDKYSGKPSDFLGTTHIAKKLRVSTRTVVRALEYGLSTGEFKKDQIVNAVGQYKLIPDDVEKVKHILQNQDHSKHFTVASAARFISTKGGGA